MYQFLLGFFYLTYTPYTFLRLLQFYFLRLASGMARWWKDELTTAQTFAHEIAHTLGVFHDWEIPNERIKNGRKDTCGPNRFKGGPNNQIMNCLKIRLINIESRVFFELAEFSRLFD